ncbi:MAG TPA: cytochrome c, partial [Polyangiales bacterium]|nr:cytochrome c [Polyangiales bacterium]
LNFLLADVILLRYEAANQLATQLLQEPRLTRPAPFLDETLNALLPADFFVQQEALAASTEALAAATRVRDDGAIVKAFGAVAQTCVACHTSYLHDPLHKATGRKKRNTTW